MTEVIRIQPLEAAWKVANLEARYPDFPEIAAMDLPLCCKRDEVAERYDWNVAWHAWGEYEFLAL